MQLQLAGLVGEVGEGGPAMGADGAQAAGQADRLGFSAPGLEVRGGFGAGHAPVVGGRVRVDAGLPQLGGFLAPDDLFFKHISR